MVWARPLGAVEETTRLVARLQPLGRVHLVAVERSLVAPGAVATDAASAAGFDGLDNHNVTRYATTTPTITNGSAAAPVLEVNSDAITTAESGNRKIATVAAPIPTATAAVTGNPGSRDARIPPAAPRKIAGNVGPPRKLPKEIE
jgi:hypothetical protein